VSYETDNPWAVVDEESDPPTVVARYHHREGAEFHLNLLLKRGGTAAREKVLRGGYGIDGPEG
jgi:hypothetical protein